MKNIDTLVQDIYNLFTRDGGPPIPQKKVEEEIEIFLEELRSHLLDFLYTKREPSSNLRLSLVGKPDRQTWYEMRNTKEREPLSSPTRIKFLYGHLLESLLLLFSTLAGHEVTDKQKKLNRVPATIFKYEKKSKINEAKIIHNKNTKADSLYNLSLFTLIISKSLSSWISIVAPLSKLFKS